MYAGPFGSPTAMARVCVAWFGRLPLVRVLVKAADGGLGDMAACVIVMVAESPWDATVMVPVRGVQATGFSATWYCSVPLPVPLAELKVIQPALVVAVQVALLGTVTIADQGPPAPRNACEVGDTLREGTDQLPTWPPACPWVRMSWGSR
jgi:hypothetical protein